MPMSAHVTVPRGGVGGGGAIAAGCRMLTEGIQQCVCVAFFGGHTHRMSAMLETATTVASQGNSGRLSVVAEELASVDGHRLGNENAAVRECLMCKNIPSEAL
ncbi:unnamed protein product [Ostreobium quekettii]|uniref:Uncharacterized protein n=1 Tax=Ostreobium quekettii TaxID=121088 RepID=A0A8S1JEU8_9CHLO|nr:unnamed protein product [Ostreobium quekettii]